ncbi:MAG: gluconolaconase [Gammaproteobacteria bacterium]
MHSGRYLSSTGEAPDVAAGWTLDAVIGPSALFGANGMKVGPDGRLYVAQAFGSQVSALDCETGAPETVVPVGSAVVAPDDLAFDTRGVMYITEVMSERVSARLPDGTLRVVASDVPVANGITAYGDRIFMDEFRPDGRILELYPDGRAPRVIAEHLALPNALARGPDDCLYFPQVLNGEIWRVPVAGGAPEIVLGGLALPTAVKFSPRGELFTVEAGSGEITRIDPVARTRHVIAHVRPGIDNFAFTPDGRLFVSHFTDGGVAEILPDGRERVLVAAGLLGPFGIACAPDGTLHVADGMSLAVVHAGRVTARPALLVNHEFPGFARAVAVAGDHCFIATSAGTVARMRAGAETVTLATSLAQPTGLAIAADGRVLVCERDAGRVLAITPEGRVTELARGLHAPTGIAVAADGGCFVSEATGGRVVHVANGEVSEVIGGLQEPHGVACSNGEVCVLDRAGRTVSRRTADGVCDIIVSNLPVGAAPGVVPKALPGIAGVMPGPLLPFADLAVAPDGALLIGADGAGAVLALRHGAR